MPFLPEEFGRTQEKTGTHLPADDIRPLVDQQGQITPAADPATVRVPDDGLAGRTDDQFLFELCRRIDDDATPIRVVHQAVMRDYRAFFRKTLHMGGFPAEKTLWNEQREI